MSCVPMGSRMDQRKALDLSVRVFATVVGLFWLEFLPPEGRREIELLLKGAEGMSGRSLRRFDSNSFGPDEERRLTSLPAALRNVFVIDSLWGCDVWFSS